MLGLKFEKSKRCGGTTCQHFILQLTAIKTKVKLYLWQSFQLIYEIVFNSSIELSNTLKEKILIRMIYYKYVTNPIKSQVIPIEIYYICI